jgi:type II secretory pathway predicted ATPase ExeA
VPTELADHGPAGTLTSALGRAGATTREAISEIRQGALGSQSYHEYFALTGYPFSDIRQPTSFWDKGPFAAAVRAVTAPVLAGQRPVMLLGAPGSGRTFVCEMIRAREPRILTFTVEPQLLFGVRPMVALCRQLGVASLKPSADQRSLVEAFLLHALPRGKADAIAVVVIDGIDPGDRELIHELGEVLYRAPRGRLSMILIGAEDLPARLAEASAPQTLLAGPPPVVLGAMTLEETVDYIDFRLRTIGGSARGLELDLATRQLLHARSGGNPKLVNVFCHNAMTIAALKKEPRVTLTALRVGMKSKSYLSPEAARALLG